MSDAWHLQRGSSRSIGPFTTEEILDGVASGEIPRDAKVCAIDGKLWLPIDATPAFEHAFSGARAVPAVGALRDAHAHAPVAETAASPSEARRRPERRARLIHVASATASGGAVAIVGLLAALLACVPSEGLARLFDATRPLRASLALLGGLAFVFGVSALLGARRATKDDASLARAAFLPGVAVVLAAFVIRLPTDLATSAELARARVFILTIVATVVVGMVAHALSLRRALVTRRRAVPIALLLVTAASILVGFGASSLAHLRDVVTVSGAVPVPLFVDEATAGRFAEAIRAGASGARALDSAFAEAVFVEPSVRMRVLDEERRPLAGAVTGMGTAVMQRVTVLDGPHRGRSLVRVVR